MQDKELRMLEDTTVLEEPAVDTDEHWEAQQRSLATLGESFESEYDHLASSEHVAA